MVGLRHRVFSKHMCFFVLSSACLCLVRHLMLIALNLGGSSFVYGQKLYSTCANRNIFFVTAPPCDLGGVQNLLQYRACGKKLMLQNQLLLRLLHPTLHWNKLAIPLYASKNSYERLQVQLSVSIAVSWSKN